LKKGSLKMGETVSALSWSLVTSVLHVGVGLYLLYHLTNAKARGHLFVLLGVVMTGMTVFLLTFGLGHTCFFSLLELVVYTLFLKYVTDKDLTITLFWVIFMLTFCYFLKLFVSIFIVDEIFQIRNSSIGGALGDLCVIPAYILLRKMMGIDPHHLIISEHVQAQLRLPSVCESERDIEKEQNQLIRLSNCLMITFYLSNNFIRLTNFRSRFSFEYLIFMAVFLFIFLIYSINVKYKEWENQRLLKYKDYVLSGLATYTKEADEAYQSVRAFRHDFANILIAMRETIETQGIEEVKQTYAAILEKSNLNLRQDRQEVVKLANIKNLEIKSIISAKILQAERRGIAVELEISEIVADLRLEKLDTIRLLGIVLDNAIEATAELETDNPTIKLAIFHKGLSRYYVIENQMRQEKLPTNLLFQAGYSTKGNNRGYGLANLEKIVSRYPTLSYHVQAKQFKFKVELEVRKG
jgi:two-component system sensor histidine kinase AgrC